MNSVVLEVKNLTKKFGNFTAVDNISFSMEEGEILGFLGPNGAGKTTTIQMLLGVLTPTSGSISYFGKELLLHREEILEKISFSSTYTNLPWYLTVRENLTSLSYLYDIENRKQRVEKLVETFHLEKLINKSIGQLSAGQITRVNIAKAFLNSPKILLLDEPTASLDPDVASYIREFLLTEKEKFHISIVFTSHNMTEVEELCDRVVFINHGRIIANDTPDKLTRSIEISHIELIVKQKKEALLSFCTKEKLPHQTIGKYVVRIDVKERQIPEFLRQIMEKGIIYDEISIDKPTLEDYFLEMSGKNNI
ncbi:MAG: ABC transporter ATP-binding protein [Candidatus Levybacteria bacterium]|nr:ABC transporter ATP-binding protein [Candidatus Levybacteria bacterium]